MRRGKVYFLKGSFRRRKLKIDAIRKELGNYEEFVYTNKSSLDEVQSGILQFSCFSEKRLIIINDIPASNKERKIVLKNLAHSLEHVPIDCTLILDNLKITAQSFLDKIKAIGDIYFYPDKIERRVLLDWLKTYFVKKGKIIEDIDRQKIFNVLSTDQQYISVDAVDTIFSKLEVLNGKRKKISSGTVNIVCNDYNLFVRYRFYHALDNRNYKECLNIIHSKFIDSPNFVEEMEILIWDISERYDIIILIVCYLLSKHNCDTLKNTHIQFSEDLWKHVKHLNRLERKGSYEKTELMIKRKSPKKNEEKGEPIKKFSDSRIRFFVNNFACYYQEKSSLYQIKMAINKVAIKIRQGCGVHETLTILTWLSKIICQRTILKEDGEFFENLNGAISYV